MGLAEVINFTLKQNNVASTKVGYGKRLKKFKDSLELPKSGHLIIIVNR